MKKYNLLNVIILTALFLSQNIFAQENTKIAQTGFQFLTVGTDARATALGEAFTTYEGTSSSLLYNPAGLARMNTELDMTLSRMSWIADITYLSATAGVSVEGGKYGNFGLSIGFIDYGEFLFTRVANEGFDTPGNLEKGYVDISLPQPYAFSIGLGYAKELSDKFSIGGQIKYVAQNLGESYLPREIGDKQFVPGAKKEYEIGVFAFDFGTLYKTGYKSLVFGMTVRNFSEEVQFEKEGFQLPLVFKIGVSMNLLDFYEELKENHSFVLSVDAAHPRSHPEYISVGGEYVFMDMVAFRAGYVTGQDLYDYTLGFGVRQYSMELNYSFTQFTDFSDVHRISLGFKM